MTEIETTSGPPVELGDPAPYFSLPSAQGASVALEQVLTNGPALLWFSPGMV